MIVYFKDQDVNVEVPDDISESDLNDMGNRFASYSADELKTKSPEQIDTERQNAQDFGTISEYKPNFFASVADTIKGFGQEIGAVDIPLIQHRTPAAYGFTGGFIEGATAHIAKPLAQELYGDAMKSHPIATTIGQIGGGIGSLMATGGALRLAGLGEAAYAAGEAGTQIEGIAGQIAQRFIPPAIMHASTFGTQTFIQSMADEYHAGNIDLSKEGEGILAESNWPAYFRAVESAGKAATVGGASGIVSGLLGYKTAIASAAALGAAYSKWEGGDAPEMFLSAAIWAGFEAIGGPGGRDSRLLKQAMSNTVDGMAKYFRMRTPNMSKEASEKIAMHIFAEAAPKIFTEKPIGKPGEVIDPANDPNVVLTAEQALNKLEWINQRIRNGQVKVEPVPGAGTTAQGEGAQEIKIEGPKEQPIPEETIQLIEQAGPIGEQAANDIRLNQAQAEALKNVPVFKSTGDAISYGKLVAGDNNAIQGMLDRISQLRQEADKHKAAGNPQAEFDAIVQAQFLNEAINKAYEPPQASGGETQHPFTHKGTVYQGRGATPAEVYGEKAVAEGRAVPLFGPGQYYAVDLEDATQYGPNVTEHPMPKMNNPIVIDSDDAWFQLLRDAGTPHLNNMDEAFYKNPAGVSPDTIKLQNYLKSQGHDAIVIKLSHHDDNTKRLNAMAGHDQIVVFGKTEISKELKASRYIVRAALEIAGVDLEQVDLAIEKAGNYKALYTHVTGALGKNHPELLSVQFSSHLKELFDNRVGVMEEEPPTPTGEATPSAAASDIKEGMKSGQADPKVVKKTLLDELTAALPKAGVRALQNPSGFLSPAMATLRS